ncbi:hypothetical protein AGMMS49928_25650 [Spirochaetia bacterium]|nr:hypothetical protein AGMMS49928_25650 [Spirochaetia bacterium]
MKAKALVLAVIFGIAAAAGSYAIGLGAQFNLGSTDKFFAPGIALALSPADKFHMAFNWYLDDAYTKIGLTADAAPLDQYLGSPSSPLSLTLGIGVFANLTFVENDMDFDAGLRIPVGFALWLGDRAFEIYTHIAPSFNIGVVPAPNLKNIFFPVALGARLWIR